MLSDPGGSLARPFQQEFCCLPLRPRRRLLYVSHFGAQSHSLPTRCLRFAFWLPIQRKTRFQLLVRLVWAGIQISLLDCCLHYSALAISRARWVLLKGFNISYIYPPFARLSWRTDVRAPRFAVPLYLVSTSRRASAWERGRPCARKVWQRGDICRKY
jgi:hypothetical protein